MPVPPRIRRRRAVPTDPTVPPGERSTLARVRVPPPPTAEEVALIEEQQVTRVEELMKKGVRTPYELQRLLDLTNNDRVRIKRWMKKARARWEVMADSEDMRTARHRLMIETSQLAQELWVMFRNTNDNREKIVILKQIQENAKFEADLSGLNKDTVLMLMNESKVPDSVLRGMAKQEELVEGMKLLAQAIRETEEQEALDAEHAAEQEEAEQSDEEDTETPDE